jgi:hypothetical protein
MTGEGKSDEETPCLGYTFEQLKGVRWLTKGRLDYSESGINSEASCRCNLYQIVHATMTMMVYLICPVLLGSDLIILLPPLANPPSVDPAISATYSVNTELTSSPSLIDPGTI